MRRFRIVIQGLRDFASFETSFETENEDLALELWAAARARSIVSIEYGGRQLHGVVVGFECEGYREAFYESILNQVRDLARNSGIDFAEGIAEQVAADLTAHEFAAFDASPKLSHKKRRKESFAAWQKRAAREIEEAQKDGR